MRRSKTTGDLIGESGARADERQVHTHREVVAKDDIAVHAGKDAHAYRDIIRGLDSIKI